MAVDAGWQDKVVTNILVTGGAGYIGSHACKALAQAGFTPISYDNLSRGYEWAVKWGPFEQGDILDRSRLKFVLEKYRPEAVLHFAGLSYVWESVKAPILYYKTNVTGSLVLLEAMRDAAVNILVYSSSCAVYGVPAHIPIRENHPKMPINPYGASKAMVERVLDDLAKADGFRFIALRYFNAAGADPEGEIGKEHTPGSHLVPQVLAAASGKLPQVEIMGDDYETPDGTCIRDYVHASDLANAHILALKYLLAGGQSSAFNLGNGKGYSVREVIETAQQITGRSIAVRVTDRRIGDPPILVADPSKAMKELGWLPQRTPLRIQISDAWRWYNRINVVPT